MAVINELLNLGGGARGSAAGARGAADLHAGGWWYRCCWNRGRIIYGNWSQMPRDSSALGNVLVQEEVTKEPPSVRRDKPGTQGICDICMRCSDSFIFISLWEVEIKREVLVPRPQTLNWIILVVYRYILYFHVSFFFFNNVLLLLFIPQFSFLPAFNYTSSLVKLLEMWISSGDQ